MIRALLEQLDAMGEGALLALAAAALLLVAMHSRAERKKRSNEGQLSGDIDEMIRRRERSRDS